ncbi:hydroxyisourate hydrolase [Bacteriovoracaceae bacterium]|nr:hydroxyisourate hydrolase [Bacteriovoracaceae bacterium]
MISTHILDTTLGSPADGVPVDLKVKIGESWKTISESSTNNDGRIAFDCPFEEGVYQLHFKVEEYFSKINTSHFFENVQITFNIQDTSRKYHVPILLNPYGYSTYRGS